MNRNYKKDMSVSKTNDHIINVNLLKNRYITDGHVWTVDETIFNGKTLLFLVIDLKTRAVLGYILSDRPKDEDLIIELYQTILEEYKFLSPPSIVHSDMEPAYHSKKLRNFLNTKNISVSTTVGNPNQNQVSESINNRIKYLVTEILLSETNTKSYRAFRQTLPEGLKNIKNTKSRCKSREYRKYLFKSLFFNNQKQEAIKQAILRYNKADFSKGITRQQASYFTSFIGDQKLENTQLVASDHFLAEKIKSENVDTVREIKSCISNIIMTDLKEEDKIIEIMSLVFQRQNKTDFLINQSFNGLTIQNSVLFEQNQELEKDLKSIRSQLNLVLTQLQEKLDQEKAVQEKRLKRENRIKQIQKEPVTEQVYNQFIEKSIKSHNKSFYGARLRIALVILLVTGARISEILILKTHQVTNLFNKKWIAIDRLKRGPANHKAFLTSEGIKILKARKQDFEILIYGKSENAFIFTAQNRDQPLNRVSFNRIVNGFIKAAVEEMPSKPCIRSHSFRIGFISQLWKDTSDIEFVRQVVGHAKIETTSKYVVNLTENERKSRMSKIVSTNDLFY